MGRVLAGAGAVVLSVTASLGGAGAGAARAATTSRPVLAYVTDDAAGYLTVINTTTAEVVAKVPLSMKTSSTCVAAPTACKPTTVHPVGVTASPNGTTVYVDCSGPNSAVGAIDVVDVATEKVTKVIHLTHSAMASAISPGGETLYVAVILTATPRKGAIDTVDLATDTVTGTVTLPTGQDIALVTDFPSPEAIVVGDGGTRLGVVATKNWRSTTPTVFLDVYPLTATRIGTPPTQALLTDVKFKAVGIGVTPTRSTRGFVVVRSTATGTASQLIVVNLATSTRVKTLTFAPTTFLPVNVAVSPNGKTVATTGTSASGGQLAPATRTGTGNNWTFGTALSFGTAPGGLGFLGNNALYAVNTGGKFVTEFDAVTTKLHTIHLNTAATPLGIAFGQAAAPPTTTTTTTSSTTTSSTTTTTTTTPVVPTGTGPRPSGPQLAYTGEDPAPELVLGGSLLAVGLGFLAVDAWRRRSPARRALHRRS